MRVNHVALFFVIYQKHLTEFGMKGFFLNYKLTVFVSCHKHLGLTLSDDLKWSVYINDIVSNACKKLGLLKKLKFTLGIDKLSKLYITFVRPILEYASVVWDGCSSAEIEKLEKVQLRAARIVTGLPILASRESLYFETGWASLSKRREIAKLTIMYKIHYNLVPQYLSDIANIYRKDNSCYSTHYEDNCIPPRVKYDTYTKSFIPDAIGKWNSLNSDIKKSTSIRQFQRSISNNSSDSKIPKYFLHGKRVANIIHTKLRHNCLLNYDLHRRNIVDSPNCICGKKEDVFHFLFVCKLFSNARNTLFNELFQIQNLGIIDSHTLPWGNDNLDYKTNVRIFTAVQNFIINSRRFI